MDRAQLNADELAALEAIESIDAEAKAIARQRAALRDDLLEAKLASLEAGIKARREERRLKAEQEDKQAERDARLAKLQSQVAARKEAEAAKKGTKVEG